MYHPKGTKQKKVFTPIMKTFSQTDRISSQNNTISAGFYSMLVFALIFLSSFAASAQTTVLGCKLTKECFGFTYKGFTRNSNNTVTLSFQIQTNCGHALSHVAFELPAGAKATNAVNSNSNFKYSVLNSTNNPFYSVKFEATNAEGFKNGASDTFSYTVTAAEFAKLTTIRVSAKASTTVAEVTFKALVCEPEVLSIAGPALVEANRDAVYTVLSQDATSTYQWTAPDGWEIIKGQGTKEITVKPSATAGQMKVQKGATSLGTMAVEGYSPSTGTLPVTLTSFTSASQTSQVVLTWITASEKDNKEFVVERSTDAVNFAPIETIAGNGTTTTLQHYTFKDAAPVAGISYYRLKQIDFDGAFEYSKVISAKVQATQPAKLKLASVYPNPF
ncbi:MAG: hypothetical protein ACO1OQ_06615, partial [Rufibacter sp.]